MKDGADFAGPVLHIGLRLMSLHSTEFLAKSPDLHNFATSCEHDLCKGAVSIIGLCAGCQRRKPAGVRR